MVAVGVGRVRGSGTRRPLAVHTRDRGQEREGYNVPGRGQGGRTAVRAKGRGREREREKEKEKGKKAKKKKEKGLLSRHTPSLSLALPLAQLILSLHIGQKSAVATTAERARKRRQRKHGGKSKKQRRKQKGDKRKAPPPPSLLLLLFSSSLSSRPTHTHARTPSSHCRTRRSMHHDAEQNNALLPPSSPPPSFAMHLPCPPSPPCPLCAYAPGYFSLRGSRSFLALSRPALAPSLASLA